MDYKNFSDPFPLLFVTPSLNMASFGSRNQRGSRSRLPIVMEQETPPSRSSKKAFEFGGRNGPNICEASLSDIFRM